MPLTGIAAYKERQGQSTEVLQENMRLLKKITTVKSTQDLSLSKAQQLPSLANTQRKQEIVRIFQENLRMVNRLAQVKLEIGGFERDETKRPQSVGIKPTKRKRRRLIRCKEKEIIKEHNESLEPKIVRPMTTSQIKHRRKERQETQILKEQQPKLKEFKQQMNRSMSDFKRNSTIQQPISRLFLMRMNQSYNQV
ncbi:hypothetical protein FGO68_gene4029 [Halteria grandinella]|uniref:Uncharacterized protein n=1 Tax=Halteria grandinella TaxID=5974 RepID=A0A8J8T6Z2_HALGN|nr:hypothetical protein FGO68_gene4029 [Halteria grandinella]